MTTTPTPPAADTVGILGLIAIFGTKDLGEVGDFQITPNIERATLESIRTGKAIPVAQETIRTEVTMTFNTANIKDEAILDLWAGGAGGGLTFDSSSGPFTIKMPGKPGTPGLQLDFPSAALSGNGFTGAFGTEFMRLNFTATALIEADAETLGTIALLAAVVTP